MPKPAKLHEFQKLLYEFMDDTMARWYKITSLRMGLSIQLEGSVREDIDPARRIKGKKIPKGQHIYTKKRMLEANFRNGFCQNTYKDRRKEITCNSLDTHLRSKLKSNDESISCRCHQGVSNILIPYKYHKDHLDISWYIYIGQFVFAKEKDPKQQESARKFLEKLKIRDVTWFGRIDEDEKAYIQEDVFIDDEEYEKKFSTSNISKIGYVDFVRFREFTLTRFQDFLDEIYNRSVGLNKTRKDDSKLKLLKDFVEEKKKDAKLLNLMLKIYTMLEPSESLQSTNSLSNQYKKIIIDIQPKFRREDAENVTLLRPKFKLIEKIYSAYEASVTDNQIKAQNFLEELNTVTNN